MVLVCSNLKVQWGSSWARIGNQDASRVAPKTSSLSVSSFHYSQPIHLLFAREDVKSNRERYGEISMGIDPRLIEHIVANLRTFRVGGSNVSQFLYLNRSGPYACIVNPW